MGNIYADFDNAGNLKGFYDDEIYSLIPETAKLISNELHRNFLENQGKMKINPEILELEDIIKTQEEIDIENQLNINTEARIFLNETDWKVIRHRDQLDLGIETSLTEQEFQELLSLRQEAREKVMEEK